MLVLSRLATFPFSRLFSCEENIEYTGCGSTEHRSLKAPRLQLWLPSCLDYWEERCRGASFSLWWKLKRTCHTHGLSRNAQFQATVNCSCICNSYDVMKTSEGKQCQNSVAVARQLDFCYTFFYNLKASKTLYSGVPKVTITRKVVVYP
jgi:hypothetical protein